MENYPRKCFRAKEKEIQINIYQHRVQAIIAIFKKQSSSVCLCLCTIFQLNLTGITSLCPDEKKQSDLACYTNKTKR